MLLLKVIRYKEVEPIGRGINLSDSQRIRHARCHCLDRIRSRERKAVP
ncbi:Uncharacterised protein [Amycolatopsis camponoti]|uniref:Uncharacterized protein n=1 Tax=Amycolatopsis camponoti TaxID=2606593 RepID=A0A6I8M2F7_9PSEU|nr:Uncharacterised protein [Amycolatopsis camponoti]